MLRVIPRVEGARYRSAFRFLYEGVEGLVVVVLVLLTWPVSKRWLANWGSTPEERSVEWAGDAFVTDPEVVNTRAVTIAAAREQVWTWIVQFGLGRAGFYSYELLERAFGIPVRNVESVLPQFQTLQVGDEIRLHPTAPGSELVSVPRAPTPQFDPTRPEELHRGTSRAVDCRSRRSRRGGAHRLRHGAAHAPIASKARRGRGGGGNVVVCSVP